MVTALIVSAPSLNSGRNDRPASASAATAAIKATTAPAMTARHERTARCSQGSYAALSQRVRRGSAPDAIIFEFGSNSEHRTGVTVSATSNEAVSATT